MAYPPVPVSVNSQTFVRRLRCEHRENSNPFGWSRVNDLVNDLARISLREPNCEGFHDNLAIISAQFERLLINKILMNHGSKPGQPIPRMGAVQTFLLVLIRQ